MNQRQNLCRNSSHRTDKNRSASHTDLEQRYKAIIEGRLSCVFLFDFQGNILDANNAMLNLLGYSREDIPHYNIASLMTEDDVPLVFQIIDEIRQNGTHVSPVELRVKRKDGEYAWVEAEGTVIQRDGNPYAIQGIARDITVFKITSQKLKESENFYRSIFENTGTATCILEENTIISKINREGENLSGYLKEEVEGKKSWVDFIVRKDLNRLREYHRMRRTAPDLVPKTYETQLINRRGNVRDILVTGAIIAGTNKGVASLLDITERKANERALKESEAKFRGLVEQLPNTVIYMAALDESSTTLYVSPQIKNILGYSQNEYKENPTLWSERLHPDDYDRVMGELQRSRRTNQPFISEYRMLHKDDRIIWFHDEAHIIKDEQGDPFVLLGVNIDITDQKVTLEKLRQRERDLELQTIDLQKMNTALNVLLKKREDDRKDIEEKILLNVQKLIEPCISELKLTWLEERQKALVSALESNLRDITSSFASSLSSRDLILTPREMEVANLIKQGKTSKEICQILGSSEKVIAFHRQNIRRKFGLLNQKVNLKSYLMAKG